MLSAKIEQMQNLENIDIEDYRLKLEGLLTGASSEAEKHAFVADLARAEALNDQILQAVIAAVRRTMPADCAAFPNLFKAQKKLIDCCGTGGSGLSHFNTSTTVAFILAAAGLQVAKFGNRAASSQSGSFDLLHKLGIGDALPLAALAQLLEESNLAFLFAPQFYPGLASLAPYRKAVGAKTIFNYIGPLLNPAAPPYRLIGVPNHPAQTVVAAHLVREGVVEQAFVVTADSGLDELDVHSPCTLLRVKKGSDGHTLEKIRIDALPPGPTGESGEIGLKGKVGRLLSADDNAEIFHALMQGQLDGQNYYHALVCLNAGAALQAAGSAASLEEGYQIAADLLEDGAALAKYNQYRQKFQAHSTGHS
jgi:anthranilate phosphoribosyltransferase